MVNPATHTHKWQRQRLLLDGAAGKELDIPLCTREDKWLTLSSVERTFYDHSERDFVRVLERIQALRSGKDSDQLTKRERDQKASKCAPY